MIFEEGKPWLLWPDSVSYGLNTGDIGKTFEGFTDFTLSIHLRLLSTHSKKKTIFAKLPNYLGVDLIEDSNKFLFILHLDKNGKSEWKYLVSDFSLDNDWHFLTFNFNKSKKELNLFLDETLVNHYILEDDEKLTYSDQAHILFAAGNFPKNNFNLNYCSYESDFILITKTYLLYNEIKSIFSEKTIPFDAIGCYDFKEKTDYKIYDKSGNCNFIHKILEN